MSTEWTRYEDKVCFETVQQILEKSNQLDRYFNTKQLTIGFSWDKVAFRIPTKTAVQCRERFLLVLSPETHNTVWSAKDTEVFELLKEKHGDNANQLLNYFPCKVLADIELKNECKKRPRDEIDYLLDEFFTASSKAKLEFEEAHLLDNTFAYDEAEFDTLLDFPLDTLITENIVELDFKPAVFCF